MFIGIPRGERREVECGFLVISRGGQKAENYIVSTCLAEREGDRNILLYPFTIYYQIWNIKR